MDRSEPQALAASLILPEAGGSDFRAFLDFAYERALFACFASSLKLPATFALLDLLTRRSVNGGATLYGSLIKVYTVTVVS